MGKAFIKMAFVISTIFDCQLSFDKSTSSVYVMYKCIQVLLDNILSKFCLFLPPSSYPSIRGGQGIFTTARFVNERAPHAGGYDSHWCLFGRYMLRSRSVCPAEVLYDSLTHEWSSWNGSGFVLHAPRQLIESIL